MVCFVKTNFYPIYKLLHFVTSFLLFPFKGLQFVVIYDTILGLAE